MNKNNILLILLTLLITLTISTFSCSLDGKLQRPNDLKYNPFIERAAMPVITAQPKDYTYFVGDVASPPVLSVTAAPPANEDADLSYRWFENTVPSTIGATAIVSATAAAYTPTVDTTTVGVNYYYVSILHHDPAAEPGYQYTEVNSKVVRVSVVTDKSATLEAAANVTLTIKADEKNQYVRGFGGISNPWTNAPNLTRADVEMMYNPDKLGYNILRIMIVPDNTNISKTMDDMINLISYSGGVSYAQGTGEKIQGKMYYDFVKTVNGYGGYVFASPWTPPAEWKTNGSTVGGGSLKKDYYPDYAKYLRTFAQIMYDNGAPIYAISIQNEPNYKASYDGCEWSGAEMRDFFKQVGHFTGDKKDPGSATTVPAFSAAIPGYGGGKPTDYVLTMNGESANSVSINNDALGDEVSRDAIDLIGRHFYSSTEISGPYALAKTHNKEVWMTEHNQNSGSAGSYPNDSTWNYVWEFMNNIDRSIRYCNENAFVWWTLKRFYSMIGDGTFATSDGDVLPRGHGLSHYAKFASEMWRCNVTAEGNLFNASNGNPVTIANSTFNPLTGINTDTFLNTSATARVTAFVSDDGNTISMVMFTPRGRSGSGGLNMGTVKIQLPEGFIAKGAVAMRSTAAAQSVWEDVALSSDRNAAFVEMPASTILSVRFTR